MTVVSNMMHLAMIIEHYIIIQVIIMISKKVKVSQKPKKMYLLRLDLIKNNGYIKVLKIKKLNKILKK